MDQGDKAAKLRKLGAFRLLLPKSTWSRAGEPRYSDKVYEVDYLVGNHVVAKDGTRAPIRDALAVPSGSAATSVPRDVKAGRTVRDADKISALRPFARALRGFLGDGGSLSLQGAGTKLRIVPGFSDTMQEQKITGNGALQRFLDLFPEFVVEGKAPKASVRLRP